MFAEQPGQFGVGRDDAAVTLGPALELPAFPGAAVVGAFAARIGCSGPQMQLAPVAILGRVLPQLAAVGPGMVRGEGFGRRDRGSNAASPSAR